jgi:hypothetical protein
MPSALDKLSSAQAAGNGYFSSKAICYKYSLTYVKASLFARNSWAGEVLIPALSAPPEALGSGNKREVPRQGIW